MPRDDDELLLLMPEVLYLVKEDFINIPTQITINDPSNVWTRTGGEYVPGSATLGTNNPGMYHTAGFTRVGGRAFKSRVKQISAYGADANKTFSPMVTWCDVAGSATIADFEGISYWIASGKFQVLDSISATAWTSLEACLADTYNVFVLVQRAGGGVFHIVDGKLIAITRQNTDSNVHPNVASLGSSRNPPQVDYFYVADLPSPWNSDFGICTTQLAGARAAADAFTHEASFTLEFTVTTLPSAGNIEVRFRVQDANNYWRLLVSNAGLFTVDVVTAGTPANLASIASCQANDRLVLCANANLHQVTIYRDRPSSGVTNTTIGSNSSFEAQLSGSVNSLGTGGAIKDLYTYPYNLSGAALAAINAL